MIFNIPTSYCYTYRFCNVSPYLNVIRVVFCRGQYAADCLILQQTTIY